MTVSRASSPRRASASSGSTSSAGGQRRPLGRRAAAVGANAKPPTQTGPGRAEPSVGGLVAAERAACQLPAAAAARAKRSGPRASTSAAAPSAAEREAVAVGLLPAEVAVVRRRARQHRGREVELGGHRRREREAMHPAAPAARGRERASPPASRSWAHALSAEPHGRRCTAS